MRLLASQQCALRFSCGGYLVARLKEVRRLHYSLHLAQRFHFVFTFLHIFVLCGIGREKMITTEMADEAAEKTIMDFSK